MNIGLAFYSFFILSLQIINVFASPTIEFELLANKPTAATTTTTTVDENAMSKGFQCGNTFFSDVEVSEVLAKGLELADINFYYHRRYSGPLFSETKSKEYFLMPIEKERRYFFLHTENTNTLYHIVYTRNSIEVVGVVFRPAGNDFIKCHQRDGLLSGSSTSIIQDTNGYQCGHEFFSDEKIQESLSLARKFFKETGEYPTPYIGHLYSVDSGYMMWQFGGSKRLFETGDESYFLVISKEGVLIDTVVRGYMSTFLRCIRSREFPNLSLSDSHSSLPVLHLRSGYQCGKIFFDDQTLQVAEQSAKSSTKKGNRGNFPYEYNGHPFNEPCLIWPITADGRLYRNGIGGPYRIFFTLDLKIKSIAIFQLDEIKLCERKSIETEKNHDTSDYLCRMQRFTHQQLVRAANLGCDRMTAGFKVYPKKYEGPRFEKAGPYFTFPLYKEILFASGPGLNRVVINSNCEIVGALTIYKRNNGEKKFVKCHRVDNGPLPKRFYLKQKQPIFEHLID